MILFFICLAATILAMLVMDTLIEPRAKASPLFRRMALLSVMPVVMFYLTIFMIGYRPFFSALTTCATLAIIVTINNVKFRELKEPLSFSDFALLRQVFVYPALYIRHIGVVRSIVICVAIPATIFCGFSLEAPIIKRESAEDLVPTLLYFFLLFGMIHACTRGVFRGAFLQLLRKFGPSTDVQRDMDSLPLVVCLIIYFFLANEPDLTKSKAQSSSARRARERDGTEGGGPDLPAFPSPLIKAVWPLPKTVVAIQSESFFDARRLDPSIQRGVLAHWDMLRDSALYHGRLSVPAWGANTMRTEFAFLSGLPAEALGVHRYNPFLHLCHRPIWTLAHHLRQLGYRTICIHPFHEDFFNRGQVYPNLGFDEFVDITAFEGAELFGPYVSDNAVADKVMDLIANENNPIFVFAITMENHGRWEKGRLDKVVAPADLETPLGSPELGLYLHHLANADRMAARLVDFLETREGDAVFSMFGDHLPGLAEAFRTVGYEDDRTDYIVWRTGKVHPRQLDISADTLNRLMLDAIFNQVNKVGPVEDQYI
ncbi:LTA synthase family protein [Magnetospirillum molischianum]|uniref:Putative capsular polysaccharide biosynthesis protein n=1 Tax=Magnetospirillum molischianum DSM 120 TaxID=1150626 RepID=H8FX04_MAGML|nr:LTA synthase family protein [Magnetospirillum molischianum]CCG42892.1 putative capsular polysaccharide biosynthesis protein [Magnetospirillum molischianum DSM 120]